jgi:hypothetical protein
VGSPAIWKRFFLDGDPALALQTWNTSEKENNEKTLYMLNLFCRRFSLFVYFSHLPLISPIRARFLLVKYFPFFSVFPKHRKGLFLFSAFLHKLQNMKKVHGYKPQSVLF